MPTFGLPAHLSPNTADARWTSHRCPKLNKARTGLPICPPFPQAFLSIEATSTHPACGSCLSITLDSSLTAVLRPNPPYPPGSTQPKPPGTNQASPPHRGFPGPSHLAWWLTPDPPSPTHHCGLGYFSPCPVNTASHISTELQVLVFQLHRKGQRPLLAAVAPAPRTAPGA